MESPLQRWSPNSAEPRNFFASMDAGAELSRRMERMEGKQAVRLILIMDFGLTFVFYCFCEMKDNLGFL